MFKKICEIIENIERRAVGSALYNFESFSNYYMKWKINAYILFKDYNIVKVHARNVHFY